MDCGSEAAQWIEAALEQEGARIVRHYTEFNRRTTRLGTVHAQLIGWLIH